MSVHLADGRCNGLCDEFCQTYLVDVGIVLESCFNILHVRTTACQNDTTKKFITILLRNLAPNIGNDFLQATFDNLNELACLYLTLLVDRVLHVIVDIAILGVCRGVFKLHLLSILLFHLQGGNILRDVVAAQRNHSQMTQDILGIDAYRCRVSTEIY